MNNNFCPECGKSLSPKATRCSCGWKEREVQTPVVADHRCQYRVRDRRCPLPGTSSQSIHGSTWYCCDHCRNLGDPQLCEAILIDAEKNYDSIMEARIDWRRKLFSEDLKIRKTVTTKKEPTE